MGDGVSSFPFFLSLLSFMCVLVSPSDVGEEFALGDEAWLSPSCLVLRHMLTMVWWADVGAVKSADFG